MLLSSILQILDRIQELPQPVEKMPAEPFAKAMASAMEKESGSNEVNNAAAELPKPSALLPAPIVPMQSFEELIRAVTKFEKPKPRVVDMFE
jgi:hypothetical protein